MISRSSAQFDDKTIRKLWQSAKPGSTIYLLSDPVQLNLFKTASSAEGIEFIFNGKYDTSLVSSDGFQVDINPDPQFNYSNLTVIRLTRSSPDESGIFFTFCAELANLTVRLSDSFTDESGTVHSLCDYISAWQEFMRESDCRLSPSKEIGLQGELLFLERWLQTQNHLSSIRSVWTGPQRTARDFSFTNGNAVEVKTSSKGKSFRAKIDSIDQLDNSDFHNLLLVAIKIEESETGRTIEDIAESIKGMLSSEILQIEFSALLVTYGFIANKVGRPLVKYTPKYMRAFKAESLPKITPGMIPGILQARYEIQIIDDNGLIFPGAFEVDFENIINLHEKHPNA